MHPGHESEAPTIVAALGASAGGVEALQRVVGGLPADFPGALVVVLHMPESGPSMLGRILARAGTLDVVTPAGPEPLRPGTVFVAGPGCHLLVEADAVRPVESPRENGHRPAVDPTFRTLAAAHGPRGVAVLLSGTRDDGTAGMARVRARGGHTLVQDPRECLYDGMVRSALEHVAVHEVLGAADIARRLRELAVAPPEPVVSAPGGSEPESEPPTRYTTGPR